MSCDKCHKLDIYEKNVEGESRKLNSLGRVGEIFMRSITCIVKLVSGPSPPLTKTEYERNPHKMPDTSSCFRMCKKLNGTIKWMQMPKFMFYSFSPVLEQSKASSASPNPLHYLQAVQSCFLKIFPSPSFLSFPLSCVRPRCILAVCSNVYTFIFDTNKQTNEKCISMITSKLSRHLLHVSEALDFYSGGAQN